MSTAIYVRGSKPNQECLFSFGEDVDIEEMFDMVCGALDDEGFIMVESFIVTSSDYLDADLLEMMEEVQREVFTW